MEIWYDYSPMNNFRSQLPDGFDLPKRISRLGELAYNLWWTWKPDGPRAFSRIDNDLWERLGHNPIRLLREVGRKRLNQAAKNKDYLKIYDSVFAAFDSYMNTTETWTSRNHPELKGRPIAYFSMEFGLHETLPIYSAARRRGLHVRTGLFLAAHYRRWLARGVK
jgi:starch phosphorylase